MFAVLLAFVTPLVFGLLPAVQASRPDLRTLISAGGRQGGAVPARRTRAALVVAEIALAMTLLVGAALLIRSFANLVSESPGFTPARVLVAGVSLPDEKYAQGDPRERFFQEFLERAGALPNVDAVGLSAPMALVNDFNSGYEIEGTPTPPEGRPLTLFYAVSPGFFDAMQIPLVTGRYISADDRRDGRRVIVISQALADRHFAGRTPIGTRMRVSQGNDDWREIVGVVGNVKQTSLADAPRAQVYEPYPQHPYFAAFSLVVRTKSNDPTVVAPDLRGVLRAMDPELPLARVQTLEQMVAGTIRGQRFSTTLIGLFGAAALLLAAVGVYGVIAYTVGLRRQEFAIRIAHGARPRDIARLVLRGAAGMAAAGIAIGGLGAWLAGGTFQAMLFNVSPADWWTYAGVAAVLGGAALAATVIPAMRAMQVNPIDALRCE
jgi:putative ABC transport system permease protein